MTEDAYSFPHPVDEGSDYSAVGNGNTSSLSLASIDKSTTTPRCSWSEENDDFDNDIIQSLLEEDAIGAAEINPVQQMLQESADAKSKITDFVPKIVDYVVTGTISMHLDCNSKFIFLEMVVDPDIAQKPVELATGWDII